LNILIVTSGLSSKKSYIADAFKEKYDADVVFGQRYREKIIDRYKYLVKMGSIAQNEAILNRSILESVSAKSYDMICIVKGLAVRKSTLDLIKSKNPQCQLVSWSSDDMYLRHNQTRCFIEAAPSYDVVFTSKSLNIKNKELQQIGFRRVEYFHQAFSVTDHYPINVEDSEYTNKITFIGYGENKRFEYMNYLAENGIRIDVYGNGWDGKNYLKRKHDNVILHRRSLLGRDYAEAISNSAISLCFLREMNRDLHTSRTFEIPACGGFMLAERTLEHESFFKEGIEAEFFDNKTELLEKVLYYLKKPDQRELIAKAGYSRTQNDNYSYHDMAELMLSKIFKQQFHSGCMNG